MTEGQRLVAALVSRLGASEVGRRLGVSRHMAGHLAVGRRLPSKVMRARLADIGVPIESWDQEAVKQEDPPPKAPLQRPAGQRGAALDELKSTVEQVDEALARLAVDAPASAHASLLRVRVDALHKIAILQGEGELTMATLVRSRLWRDLLSKLEPILERHPDVAAEIAEVLEALEGP